jgi:hypothetical protein
MQYPEKIWPGHEHGFQFHVAILHVRVSGVPQLNRLPMRFVSKFCRRAVRQNELEPVLIFTRVDSVELRG